MKERQKNREKEECEIKGILQQEGRDKSILFSTTNTTTNNISKNQKLFYGKCSF